MGRATFQKTLIFPSTQVKSRSLGTSSKVTLRMKSQQEGELTSQSLHPEKAAGSKYNSTSGLTPHEKLETKAEFYASTQAEA